LGDVLVVVEQDQKDKEPGLRVKSDQSSANPSGRPKANNFSIAHKDACDDPHIPGFFPNDTRNPPSQLKHADFVSRAKIG
jgi:hypothetical protein